VITECKNKNSLTRFCLIIHVLTTNVRRKLPAAVSNSMQSRH